MPQKRLQATAASQAHACACASQGFVRLALETGASLVPVLCFGENDLFDAQVVGAHTLMGRFQM